MRDDTTPTPQLPASSAIQYITDNGTFELTFDDQLDTFWLSQRQISEMFSITAQAVGQQVQNFRKSNADILDSVVKHRFITASDGKTYNVEHYALDVVIYIGYRAKATVRTTLFQRWATNIIKQHVADVIRIHLELTYSKDLQRALRMRDAKMAQGMPLDQAVVRTELAESFSELTGNIIRMIDQKYVGWTVNVIYQTMFGVNADGMKRALRTENIRDALPELQLEYLKLGESAVNATLAGEEADFDTLRAVVIQIFTPLADQLRSICDAKNIHHITGLPLK